MCPRARAAATVLLVPGIHSMGIEEPRLTALADDLAGAGVKVMAMALPDLQAYRITPRATDVIEDAVTWMSARPDLAPDGRVGIVGHQLRRRAVDFGRQPASPFATRSPSSCRSADTAIWTV